jgi:hypothetical protein
MDLDASALSRPTHGRAAPEGEIAIQGSAADQIELRILNAGRIPAEGHPVMLESQQIVFARGGSIDVVKTRTSCPTSPREAS